jgi:hypothetical protein
MLIELDDLLNRVRSLSKDARSAIAVASAQKLMNGYIAQSADNQNPFVTSWGSTLILIWKAIEAPSVNLAAELSKRNKEYMSGPYCHELGSKALPGIDENAAAASFYALNAFLTGNPNDAAAAVSRVIDDADVRADRETEMAGDDLMSESADRRRDDAADAEIVRLNAAVGVLERQGVSETTVATIRGTIGV